MNGPIAQIVALTCYGNAFLQGTDVGEFFPKNSTCLFCDRVTFVTLEKPLLGKPKEKEVAKTPEEWFNFIKSIGAKGIRLSQTPQNDPHISDRMSAGFVGGGGTSSMEVLLPKNRSEFWIARWEVWNQDAPEQRIWRVTYGRVSEGATARTGPHDLQNTATRLTQALREIHAFSTKHDCGGFTQCFADALDTLDSGGKNLHGYHKDLAPEGYLSHQAQTVLHACQKAWVFGGMGSWNDMGFDGDHQKEYERVSEQLFQDLNEAISVGANESYYRLEQGAEGDAVNRAP
ncbi:MAG: hypothetical protein ACYTG0_11990 [Planctomycetota bacterium]|jgi:hypothetical protein